MNPIKSEDELREQMLREQILDLAYIPPDATRESPLQLLSVDDIVNLITNLQHQHERELEQTYKKAYIQGGIDELTVMARLAELTNNQGKEK